MLHEPQAERSKIFDRCRALDGLVVAARELGIEHIGQKTLGPLIRLRLL